MIRVAIVEDETLVRIGLKACLEENPEVVVTDVYATAEEAEYSDDRYQVAGEIRFGFDERLQKEISPNALRCTQLL